MRSLIQDNSDGIDGTGGTGGIPTVRAKNWATVPWSYLANAPNPAYFEVILYIGSDPTATANYLLGPIKCLATDRSLITSFTPRATADTVNAAVRAVFPGGNCSSWATTTVTASSTPSTTDVATNAALVSATGTTNANALSITQMYSQNWLTPSDQISMMNTWSAELSMKASIDSMANAAGISPATYDATFSTFSSNLIAAGAPSNWQTTWPSGSPMGPSTNIMSNVGSWLAAIASARVVIQNSVSQAAATAASNAAVSTAASNAAAAISLQAPAVLGAGVSHTSISLPNSSYPANKMVLQVTDNTLWQVNAAGTGWITPGLQSSQLIGQLTGSQIAAGAITPSLTNIPAINPSTGALTAGTVGTTQIQAGAVTAAQTALAAINSASGALNANTVNALQIAQAAVQANAMALGSVTQSVIADPSSHNLIPNPTSELPTPAGGWPSGAYEAVGLSTSIGAGYGGSNNFRAFPAGAYFVSLTPKIPCVAGEQFYFECFGMASSGGSLNIALDYWDSSGNWINASNYLYSGSGVWTSLSCTTQVAPSNAVAVTVSARNQNSVGTAYADNLYFGKCIKAAMVMANAIQAGNLAAGSVTAGTIAAGAVTTATLAAGAVTAAAISAGSIGTSALSANCVTAAQIAANSITGVQIASNTLTSNQIAAQTITAYNVALGTLTGDRLMANTITAAQIAANTITAAQIASQTITASQIATGSLTAGNMAAGAICAANMTLANLDNLVPNPTSDMVPPTGGWPSGAWETQGLVSGGAYQGTYYRAVTAFSTSSYNWIQLTPNIPCSAGDQFYAECMRRSSDSSIYTNMTLDFCDVNGNWIAGNYNSISGTAWSKDSRVGVAPPGACFVRLLAGAIGNPGQAAYFDNFYMRRMADASLIVDGSIVASKIQATAVSTYNFAQATDSVNGGIYATAGAALVTNSSTTSALITDPNGFKVGTHLFTDYWFRLMNAIDGSQSSAYLIMRGNNDPTQNGGAPDISRIQIFSDSSVWDGSVSHVHYDIGILPTATLAVTASDNQDDLHFVQIKFYTSSNTSSLIGTKRWAINGRLYRSNASANTDNEAWTHINWLVRGYNIASGTNYQPSAYLRASLWNSYGPSAEQDFAPATSSGAQLATTTLSGTAPGGGGGGGGAGGGGCPAPWVPILLASGLSVSAGSLTNDVKVVGVDLEGRPAVGTIKGLHKNWVKRVRIVLQDGRAPEFTFNHRVALAGEGRPLWVEVRDLKPGDLLMAQRESRVVRIEAAGMGQVISFQVEGCSTYFTDDILSHNLKARM